MGWSTSELARLTGTTVNTIRHYHKLGLLTEPERMSNGYKQYGASHLLRLHQIRRMRELGIPLADIGAVEDDHEQQQLALKQLESDLGEQIAALERHAPRCPGSSSTERRSILLQASSTSPPGCRTPIAH